MRQQRLDLRAQRGLAAALGIEYGRPGDRIAVHQGEDECFGATGEIGHEGGRVTGSCRQVP
jgi:hypothetical protein